jgi:hypothetical protein
VRRIIRNPQIQNEASLTGKADGTCSYLSKLKRLATEKELLNTGMIPITDFFSHRSLRHILYLE